MASCLFWTLSRKVSCLFQESNLDCSVLQAHSLVTTLTELSQWMEKWTVESAVRNANCQNFSLKVNVFYTTPIIDKSQTGGQRPVSLCVNRGYDLQGQSSPLHCNNMEHALTFLDCFALKMNALQSLKKPTQITLRTRLTHPVFVIIFFQTPHVSMKPITISCSFYTKT
jgi:hypothetical protein